MNQSLFEPLVMFFGPTNSLEMFQKVMNDIFKEFIDEGVVIMYMDNILIFSKTQEHHHVVMLQVLAILQKHHLYLKVEKCTFVRSQCTALFNWKSEVGGGSDSGFSSYTVLTYYCESEYFYNQHLQKLIGTGCSLNRDEHRVIKRLEYFQ